MKFEENSQANRSMEYFGQVTSKLLAILSRPWYIIYNLRVLKSYIMIDRCIL